MQAENWDKVKETLRTVLEIEPSKRRGFLAEAEVSPEIRAEVESLLTFEAGSKDFMTLPLAEFSKDFVAEDVEVEFSLIGQKVGIYEIVGELGVGGMGAVYLAERKDEKFEQKVAIKMLKREFNVEKIRRNFKREKEILAKLNHPNIARLLDAGTTADGVPYLVMEYIEGVPVDEFCEENKLSLNARLKLFNKVCEAVSFAHRNLIIHRDLKPSNILVTEKGEPKLLDFGISKLLGAQNSEEKTFVTAFGAMTPEYASPEQIRGENITTATDIYSLGVVLYKILTDSHPFDLKGKTTGEVLKIITENQPVCPSSVVHRPLQNSEKQLTTDDERRTKSLKGDLDNITLKSLRKNPERRYRTVEQLATDIWRYLDGLPVLARRTTAAYRASKFYQRNKISVLAGLFILLALIAGIAAALWQANVARQQANVAREQTDIALDAQRRSEIQTEHAKQEEEKAKKITVYMSRIFSYAKPQWYAEGAKFKGETKVIEAMEDLGDKIDTDFAGQADIQAELHHKFADVFSSAVSVDKYGTVIGGRSEKHTVKSLEHARRALELRRQFYGERHELVAKDMVYLYWTGGVGQTDEAAYLMAAINMMRETNPNNLNLPYMLEAFVNRLMMPDQPKTQEQYRNAVFPPTTENKYQIGERYLREMLPVFRLHYKEDNYAIFVAECKLAYALAMQENRKDFDEHFAVCKQGQGRVQDAVWAKAQKNSVELVEKVLAEKTVGK